MLVPLVAAPRAPPREGHPSAGSSAQVQQQGGRADFPLQPPAKRARGSREMALAVAADERALAEARAALEKDFYANSSRAAVSAKRVLAGLLAARVAATRGVERGAGFPLSVDVVLDVAAALKAGSFASAPQILAELRLEHIERGYAFSATLARAFQSAKRSATRGLGPVEKAAELKLEDICVQVSAPDPVPMAFEAYVIAVRFLLREIELANLRCGQVLLGSTSAGLMTVRIHLPVSKMDSQGSGAMVTPACSCGATSFSRDTCAAHVAEKCLAARRREGAGDGDPLFPREGGGAPSKAEMVRAWAALAPPGHPAPGGHSARRTGAKTYARAGWPVASIQAVGRWASATVLEYIEEAIRELPRGSRGEVIVSEPATADSHLLPLGALLDRVARAEDAIASLVERGPQPPPLPDVEVAAPSLPFLVNVRSGVLHARASGSEPRTCCGWHFGSCMADIRAKTEEQATQLAHLACGRCSPLKTVLLRRAEQGVEIGT